MPDAVHLSSIAGSPLLDSTGAHLGRVEDVVARLDTGVAQPLVVGLKARIGGRELFVPIDRIQDLDPARSERPRRSSTSRSSSDGPARSFCARTFLAAA